jgi:hypothetical protein
MVFLIGRVLPYKEKQYSREGAMDMSLSDVAESRFTISELFPAIYGTLMIAFEG